MKSFYPNIEYNKSKRRKFFVLFIVAMFFLCGLLSVFLVTAPKNSLVWVLAALIALAIALLPGVFKSYPTKMIPLIQIDDKKVIYGGKYEVGLSDIIQVKVNVSVQTYSKLKPEIEAELKQASNYLEAEEFFGDVDLVIKGKDKEERLYAAVQDCIGALQALVDFGVKKYDINLFSGKVVIKSNYKLSKTTNEDEGQNNLGLSRKERFKQLL